MVVIMPDEIEGLIELQNKMRRSKNYDIRSMFVIKKKHVELSIPKFKMQTQIDLESALKSVFQNSFLIN